MMWRLHWSEDVLEDISRLDRPTRKRIHQAMRRFSETGHGDVRRIRGREREWALRVGKWRVFFEYVHEEPIIRVLRVRPRGGAYKK